MNPARRRLLVLTYYYPPQPGSGSSRWAAMAEHLRGAGHEVTVLTAAPPGQPQGVDGDVVRTGNLNSSPLLRRLLLRGGRSAANTSDGAQSSAAGSLPPLLWKGIVPDPWLLTWNPYALRAARRLLRERRYDCLITSSPAHSTHLVALALGARSRPAWLADFRDGWSFEPLLPPFPTPPQRTLDHWLERRVATRADAVVAVTRPITEDFGGRFGVAAEHVANGWDPDLLGRLPTAPAVGKADPGRLTLLHTGALSGAWGRNPRALLAALRQLIAQQPRAAERIELLLAGELSDEDRRLLGEYADLGDVLRPLGRLEREQALALQREADVLILITSRNRGEATGKLYEYMAAGRPVLALAADNEAARIVRETNLGRAVAPDDAEAVLEGLEDALAGTLQATYAPQGTERYSYPPLAERMAAIVETAIERRAARRGS
ncbi:MAG TPA: glycosyltransferase [Solirubrobacteraceae bacterium]